MYLSPDYIIVSYKNLRLTTVAVVFMHKCLQKGSSLHRVWFYIRTYLLENQMTSKETLMHFLKRFHNRNRCRRLACIAYQRIENPHLRPRFTPAITLDKVIGTKSMTKGH